MIKWIVAIIVLILAFLAGMVADRFWLESQPLEQENDQPEQDKEVQ